MTTVTTPTPIQADCLYTLSDFSSVTGLGRHALRTARRRGLKVSYVGRRGYIRGSDFLSYVEAIGNDDKPAAHP